MTTVRINPGVCGFVTKVTAEAHDDDRYTVTVHVVSGCKAISGMMDELGSEFKAFEVCLSKPGDGPFFKYAREKYPVHAGCPIIAGITKCIEAECHLALKRDCSIEFLD